MTKIKNLDELLNSDDSNRSIIELDNFIGELCDYGDDFSKLTDQQKLFYLNQNLEREINNGGFNQYFINSSGDNAHETILSLKAIGADKTADILQKAIDQFPIKTVPKDRDKRSEIVEQIEEVADEVWNDLDQKFYQYEDNLNALNIEYIKKHKDFF
ncbi:MAG: DMP19 family protein [Chitinophagaceae bacterium]|nr:DMP19 family protein [Chitinophagaceae bacterium]